MGWISVKNRLPEIKNQIKNKNPSSDPVLVFNGRISVSVRWMCGNEEYFLSNEEEDRSNISHWMVMPLPPLL